MTRRSHRVISSADFCDASCSMTPFCHCSANARTAQALMFACVCNFAISHAPPPMGTVLLVAAAPQLHRVMENPQRQRQNWKSLHRLWCGHSGKKGSAQKAETGARDTSHIIPILRPVSVARESRDCIVYAFKVANAPPHKRNIVVQQQIEHVGQRTTCNLTSVALAFSALDCLTVNP